MLQKIKPILYHGTIDEISAVDVTAGRDRKDFGKGFYLATTKSQAVGMMHKKYREAVRRSKNKKDAAFQEILYEIHLDEQAIQELNIKVFENADMEWLDFVLKCRKGGTPHQYDLVVGPTADDDTALCLKAYQDGLYGKVDSSEAKTILLNNLEVENLGIQYFVGNQEIANRLITDIIKVDWR